MCIDPETKLPFMVNMGLSNADICDLDNRPKHVKKDQTHRNDSQLDVKSESSFGGNDFMKRNQQNDFAILDPRNYPFY